MQKEAPMSVIAGAIVACCLFLGFMVWHFLVPQRVILEKGAKIPPQPDYRTGANVPPTAYHAMGAGNSTMKLTPPDYRTGANSPTPIR